MCLFVKKTKPSPKLYLQFQPDFDKFNSMNFEYFRENVDSTPNGGVCFVVDGKKMDMDDLGRVLV